MLVASLAPAVARVVARGMLALPMVGLLLLAACGPQASWPQAQRAALARAYRLGDFPTAIAAAHTLLAQDTTNLPLADTLAHLYFLDQRYPQALQVAQAARQQDSLATPRLLETQAYAHLRLGQLAQALPVLQLCETQDTARRLQYRFDRATALAQMGLADSAANLYQAVVDDPAALATNRAFMTDNLQYEVPYQAAARNALAANVWVPQGQLARAATTFEELSRRYPQFAQAMVNLAALQRRQAASAR